MAGVKGKSGGKRVGAGRKPAQKALEADSGASDDLIDSDAPKQPLEFLLAVMNSGKADPKLRVKAAVAAAQYLHMKKGDGGKKDEEADKAKKAGQGRFKAAPAPLTLVRQ